MKDPEKVFVCQWIKVAIYCKHRKQDQQDLLISAIWKKNKFSNLIDTEYRIFIFKAIPSNRFTYVIGAINSQFFSWNIKDFINNFFVAIFILINFVFSQLEAADIWRGLQSEQPN